MPEKVIDKEFLMVKIFTIYDNCVHPHVHAITRERTSKRDREIKERVRLERQGQGGREGESLSEYRT